MVCGVYEDVHRHQHLIPEHVHLSREPRSRQRSLPFSIARAPQPLISCLRGRPALAGSHTRWRRAGFSHWVSRRLGPARCRVPVPRPFWWLSSIPLGACSTCCCRIHQLGRAGFLRSLAIMSQAAINAVHRFLSVHCFKFSWGYTWPRNRRVPRRLCV